MRFMILISHKFFFYSFIIIECLQELQIFIFNIYLFMSIKISLFDLKHQKKFLKKVQLIESIQSKQKSSIKEINTLFDALMQKAFNGGLVEVLR